MTKKIDNYEIAVNKALNEKDANKLDLALRAQYHAKHAGKQVDTTNMQFPEVLKLDPVFYTKTMTDLLLPKDSVLLHK